MPTLTRQCATCGAAFTRYIKQRYLAMGRGKFCSLACAGKAKHNLTHGHSVRDGKPSGTYISWRGMKERCYNQNHKHFGRYGGRGIDVCPEWVNSFEAFLEDMGERPAGHSLDRIDNEKSYSKENCRWSTGIEQALNKGCNAFVTYAGERIPCSEASRRAGISLSTLYSRIKYGWPESLLFDPPSKRKRFVQR